MAAIPNVLWILSPGIHNLTKVLYPQPDVLTFVCMCKLGCLHCGQACTYQNITFSKVRVPLFRLDNVKHNHYSLLHFSLLPFTRAPAVEMITTRVKGITRTPSLKASTPPQ